MWSNIIKLQGPTSTSHFSVQDKKAFHALKMDVIFNVLKSVGRITTHCVTFKTACVKISVNVITCWRGMIFVFLCAVLKRNARRAILNKLSSTQETPQLLFLKRVCVCVCLTWREREWVYGWVIQQFAWVGSLFWFLLFFSPFQCFPPLLCSKDKFGRFAKFITFHWWNPSPCHPSSTPSSPSSPLFPVLLLATCTDLLVLSFVPHSSSSVVLKVRLGSIPCQFYQPTMLIHCVIHLLMIKHSDINYIFSP